MDSPTSRQRAEISSLASSGSQPTEWILWIRGERVILDTMLAALFGVGVGQLNQAVKRASARFPADFMFQLTDEEADGLQARVAVPRSRGGRRHRPYAFTEHGVAMLSSVLRSPRAVQVNIEIMRAFVRLRRWLADNQELAKRLDALESKYDSHFKIVFDAIRELMQAPPASPTPSKPHARVGFRAAPEPAPEPENDPNR